MQQRLSLCGKENDKDGSGKDTLVHEEIAGGPWLEGRARCNGRVGVGQWRGSHARFGSQRCEAKTFVARERCRRWNRLESEVQHKKKWVGGMRVVLCMGFKSRRMENEEGQAGPG